MTPEQQTVLDQFHEIVESRGWATMGGADGAIIFQATAAGLDHLILIEVKATGRPFGTPRIKNHPLKLAELEELRRQMGDAPGVIVVINPRGSESLQIKEYIDGSN